MADNEIRLWGIHTLDNDLFLKENIIAIGWDDMGDLSKIEPTREAFKKYYSDIYKDASAMSVAVSSSIVYRFVHEIKKGDYVVYPSKKDRMVNIGIVTGDYEYCKDRNEYTQQRSVKWEKSISRINFSQGALYEIGSFMSVFSIKNFADEFIASLSGRFDIKNENKVISEISEQIISSTNDFIIKSLNKHLKGYEMEKFVADLLNAMCYKTTISEQGGDRGIDIVAYKDELPPRIVVQVKSKYEQVGEAVIQSLKGAMSDGDYGLFVTLSGYTSNAKSFLKANPKIRGIDGVELVDLILKYYEDLSEEYKKIIPLKKVYIPASSE